MATELMQKEFINDFKKLVDRIDYNKYNPSSVEFVNAVNTGIMAFLLSMGIESNDSIRNEMIDAEKYYKKYIETSDAMYKQMAMDEVHHADYLIRQSVPVDDIEKARFNSYENWLQSLLVKLKSS